MVEIVGEDNVRKELRMTIGREFSYLVCRQQLIAAVFERDGRQQAYLPCTGLLFLN